MLKRMIVLILVFLTAAAQAKELPQIAVVDMHMGYQKYMSYTIDENSLWKAYDIAAQHLLDSAAKGKAGNCFIVPSLRGDAENSYAEVVLHVYISRNTPVNAKNISISVGNVRYDFVAGSKTEKIGNRQYERIDLPLNEQGLELLLAMADHGCDIYIYGDGKPFVATIREAGQLTAVRSAVDGLPDEYIDNYSLWDENNCRWPDDRPTMSVVKLSGSEYSSMMLEAFCIMDISIKDNVMFLQQQLQKGGFYTGEIDGKYGADTAVAVMAAQQYYGYPGIRFPDERLLMCIDGDGVNVPDTDDVPPAEVLSVDGYWFARKITPIGGFGEENSITTLSNGNLLFVASGSITNLWADEMIVPMDARLVVDGKYAYPCITRCEKSGETIYETTLLPLEKARLVIYAEVPVAVLEKEEIALFITSEGENGSYSCEFILE